MPRRAIKEQITSRRLREIESEVKFDQRSIVAGTLENTRRAFCKLPLHWPPAFPEMKHPLALVINGKRSNVMGTTGLESVERFLFPLIGVLKDHITRKSLKQRTMLQSTFEPRSCLLAWPSRVNVELFGQRNYGDVEQDYGSFQSSWISSVNM